MAVARPGGRSYYEAVKNPEARVQERLADPDPERIDRICSLGWSAHNIPLSAMRSTLEGQDLPLVGDDPRTVLIRRLVRQMGKEPESRELRLLDLGALEGGLSFEMARLGFDVLCVEGREENAQKCREVVDYFGLTNLQVLRADVRSLAPSHHGTFDVILCCGLLYHLDEPLEFLRKLRELANGSCLLFVDTHIAPDRDEDLEGSAYEVALSPLEQLSGAAPGYQGRWIAEHDPLDDGTHPWASIGNERSFWLTRQSLLRGLQEAGFGTALEVFGAFAVDAEMALRREHCRGYFAGF